MSKSVATSDSSTDQPTPPAVDWAVVLLIAAFGAMFLPTYYTLSLTAWGTDSNGHGPMILGLCFWLLWRDRAEVLGVTGSPAPVAAFLILSVALVLYIIGRSQGLDTLEASAQIPALMAGLLLLRGWAGVRKAWFPIFFLIFMVPLPGVVTQALTLPLKSAVSYLAEIIMHGAGYPVGRSGVTLVVGPYQLLVADACSGLNSIFTLESLGLFYMKLMSYKSRPRNILLATMIIPISFVSNVVRVLILILITYHFGDQAGQGFMHGFAGMVLFAVALTLTYAFDRLLAARFDNGPSPTKGGQA
jgi:exosortase B